MQQIRRCTECAEHLPLEPRPVFQFGADAPILLVSQAPGTAAHRSGMPFDDPSGDRLRRWLGVSPDSFYNTNHFSLLPVGFCYPGKGNGGDLPPRPECAKRWRNELLGRLNNVQLTLLVGAHAANWHMNKPKATLGNLVERWQSRWPDTVVLPHPSPRNTYWINQRPWIEDTIVPAVQERVAQLLGSTIG
jgi:uracil-DNA glycosylase